MLLKPWQYVTSLDCSRHFSYIHTSICPRLNYLLSAALIYEPTNIEEFLIKRRLAYITVKWNIKIEFPHVILEIRKYSNYQILIL